MTALAPAIWTDVDKRYADSSANHQVTSTAAENERRWRDRVADLLAIRRYEDNWDGNGSSAPQAALVDAAIAYLGALRTRTQSSPPATCIASPDGSIIVIWEGVGEYVEVEIGSSGRAEWMRKRGSNIEQWSESLT